MCCVVFGNPYPAMSEVTLDIMKERLIGVQVIALGFTGRLP